MKTIIFSSLYECMYAYAKFNIIILRYISLLMRNDTSNLLYEILFEKKSILKVGREASCWLIWVQWFWKIDRSSLLNWIKLNCKMYLIEKVLVYNVLNSKSTYIWFELIVSWIMRTCLNFLLGPLMTKKLTA